MLLPLLPAFMLPLALALALTVVVAVLWWHTTRRAQH
jgi:sensor domain CHASE-containing protein